MAYPGPKRLSAISAFVHRRCGSSAKPWASATAVGVLQTMPWGRVVDRLEEIYIDTIDRKRRKRDRREAVATMRAHGEKGLSLGARRNDVSAD
jgi:hypothetical protein